MPSSASAVVGGGTTNVVPGGLTGCIVVAAVLGSTATVTTTPTGKALGVYSNLVASAVPVAWGDPLRRWALGHSAV